MTEDGQRLVEESRTQAYLERFQEELRDLLPVATGFLSALGEQIRQLLASHKVDLGTPVEGRVKSWPSIEAKLGSRHFGGASLTDLDDLVGLRVILLFHRDLARTCDLLRSTFDVTREEDKAVMLAETSFGYQSVHLVIRLPKQWLSVPTLAPFEGLRAEIQVRTLPQHLWAAASHVLQYKHEDAVPAPVRRSLSRVSALLETVDTEFEHVLQERDKYRASLAGNHGQQRLNVDLLAAILDESLPAANRRAYEAYWLLLWELKALGVKTARQLRDIIGRHSESVLASKARSFFTHAGLLRVMLEEEFGRDFYSKIWDRVGERYR